MSPKELAGDLTLQRWVIWNELTIDPNADPRLHFDRSQDPELRSAYDRLKNSQFFVKNFLQLPYTLQSRARYAVVLGYSVASTEAYCILYLKLRDKKHSLAKNFEKNMPSVYQEAYSIVISPLSSDDLEEFYVLQNEFTIESDESMLDETIFLLLILLYGWNVTLEIVRQWNSNNVTRDLPWLVKLMDRWDELSVYPVDWALQLLGVDTKQIGDKE